MCACQHLFQVIRLHFIPRLFSTALFALLSLVYILYPPFPVSKVVSVLAHLSTFSFLFPFVGLYIYHFSFRCNSQNLMLPFLFGRELLALPPIFRRFLLICLDALLLPLAVWLSFWLRLANPFHRVSWQQVIGCCLLFACSGYLSTHLPVSTRA